MTEDKNLKVGVWVDNGLVYWRSSNKGPIPRKYKPKEGVSLEEVRSAVSILHNTASMGSWTAQIEASFNDDVEELKKIADLLL